MLCVRHLHRTVCIAVGTYCVCTFLSFLFMHSFEDVDCMQGLLKKNENQLAMSFNLMIRCMDDFIH